MGQLARPRHPHHLGRRWRGAAGLLAVAALVLGGVSPAAAVDDATISGTVTDATGSGVADIEAAAYQLTSGSWEPVAWASTDATGAYAIPALPAGTYRVGFQDYNGVYQPEFWDDSPDVAGADDVVVAESATVAGRDAVLASAPHLTGTVTDATDTPLESVDVTAYQLVAGSWEWATAGSTDATGVYDLSLPTAGTYRIAFEPQDGVHLAEFWNDAATLATADDVTVAASAVVTRNAVLATASHVTGRVTDAAGSGLADVSVNAYSLVDGNWDATQYAMTDATGHYDLTPLAPGTYRIGFEPSGDFLPEFWKDAADVATATDVTLGASATQDLGDAVLGTSSHLTGRVTDAGGAAIAGVPVTAWTRVAGQWEATGSATTSDTGAYDVGGLTAGTYRIGFDPTGDYLPEYWNDKSSLETADDVTLGASDTSAGHDAVLATPSHISGRLTNAAGAGLANIEVQAFEIIANRWVAVESAATNGAGDYDVGGLSPGTYRLRFTDGSGNYAREFWDDAVSRRTATNIALGPASTVSGKDAVLAATGHITGRLTAASGAPLASLSVTAYRLVQGEWDWAGSTTTSSTGDYDVNGLLAGTYRLRFTDFGGNYTDEYWDDAATLETATDVSVPAGGTVSGKDGVLAATSHLTGTVTDGTAAPVGAVQVTAYRQTAGSWTWAGSASTNSAGTYDVNDLVAGTYRLRFSPSSPAYAEEYWDDQPTLDTATDIPLATSSTVSGRDAVLAAGSHVTGTVTGPAGGALSDIRVTAYRQVAGSWQQVRSSYTDATGHYDVGGLAAATYRLGFTDYSGAHLDEYWDDQPTVATATDVVVPAGVTLTGHDAVLTNSSHITGTVTGPGGAVLPWVAVTAYHLVNGSWREAAYASANDAGAYDLDGLAPGTYRIGFEATGYAPEYWDDAGTVETATDVVVGTDATVTGRDAVLGGAHVTGTVTDGTGAGLPDISVAAYRLTGGQWTWEGRADTDAGGHYDLAGLVAGTYRIGFDDTTSRYADEYWDDQPTLAGASDIVVPASGTVAGKDALLGPASHITGRVTSTTGIPLDEVAVVAYRQVDGSWESVSDEAETFADGTYDVTGLSAGTYRLEFWDPLDEYVGEYWNDAASLDTASDVVVGAAATSTGRDAQLVRVDERTSVANTSLPTIAGSPVVGGTLTASPGTWTPSGVTFTYVWLADGVEIGGASGTTYSPVAADSGKRISVRVTGARAGYLPATATSAATAPVGAVQSVVNTALPTISGTPVVGGTLTAAPGTWTPATGVTFSYQWLADGTAITGATGTTYTPVAGDVGKAIRVRVTGTRTGYQDGTATSAATAPVTQTPDVIVNQSRPSISGVARVGRTLTAAPGSWTPAGLTYAYAWSVGDSPVATATAATFVVPESAVGQVVTVTVTASRTGLTPASSTSPATASVAPGVLVLTTAPRVTGRPRVGKTLTALPGAVSPAATGVTYQWLRSGKVIAGATSSTYKLTRADRRKVMAVRVTYFRTGYVALVRTSKGTRRVR